MARQIRDAQTENQNLCLLHSQRLSIYLKLFDIANERGMVVCKSHGYHLHKGAFRDGGMAGILLTYLTPVNVVLHSQSIMHLIALVVDFPLCATMS